MDPASAVFVLLLPVAAITAIQGARHRYFLRDEWILLAERRLVPADLLTDIGGHLVAIPLLFYRAVFSTRGIGSYMPYLVTIILLHLTVAGLQRVTMRRSGVRPWIATAAAALLLFLGNARENIVWAFQMTLVGSLAFGLAHLILADHAGRWDRRDAFGLAAGLAGILCSALGLTMVFCVGIATLLRRGWQIAVVHTLPLAGTYLLWSLISGGAGPPNISPTVLLEWNARASNATFRALGDSRGIGVALAVILILGWALAGRRRGFRSLFTGGSLLPLSLILGAVFFQTSTATQRSVFGAGPAASTRYIYISAVLILPAIAFALEEVAAVLNDKRLAALMTLCVLVPGIAGNAIELSRPFGPWTPPFFTWERDWVAAIPRMPESRLVAPENRPEPNEAPWVTVGWLREALRSRRLGEPRKFGPMREAQVRSMILLNQQPGVVTGKCRRIRSETSLLLRRGAAVELRDPASITVLIDQQLVRNRTYGPTSWDTSPQRLEATLRDLRLRISPRGSGSLVLCGPELPDPRPPAT